MDLGLWSRLVWETHSSLSACHQRWKLWVQPCSLCQGSREALLHFKWEVWTSEMSSAVCVASANVGWDRNLDESTFTIFYLNPVLLHSHSWSLCPHFIALIKSSLRLGHFAFSHQLFFSQWPFASQPYPPSDAYVSLLFHCERSLRVVPVEVNSHRKPYILKYPYKSRAPLLSSSQLKD